MNFECCFFSTYTYHKKKGQFNFLSLFYSNLSVSFLSAELTIVKPPVQEKPGKTDGAE